MTVTIQVKYNSPTGLVIQTGTFPLNKITQEQIAYEWI